MESQTNSDLRRNVYFQNERIREHLIKSGLINRQGVILPAPTTTAKRKKPKPPPRLITNRMIEEERKRRRFLQNYFDFAMKRDRVQTVRESRRPKHRTKSLTFVDADEDFQSKKTRTQSSEHREKRPTNRVKSARSIPLSVKNLLPRRPTATKSRIIEDNCEVTMVYYGPPKNTEQKGKEADEILIMQQHNGGENLPVFKGFVQPNEIFKFTSRRHPEYPFALALYINGLIDTRISVCCEYKHKHNVRLGSKYGLFGIYDVKKSQPCPMCRFEQRKKQILATSPADHRPSPYRRSVLTTAFSPGAMLRTPVVTPEKNQTPKDRTNRVSTVARASGSSRATASPTVLSGSEDKNLNGSINTEPIRRSSTTTDSSFPKKTTDPHHSSAPILMKSNSETDESDPQHRPSKPTDRFATRSRSPSESSSTISSIPSEKTKPTMKRLSVSSSSSEELLRVNQKEPLYNRRISDASIHTNTSDDDPSAKLIQNRRPSEEDAKAETPSRSSSKASTHSSKSPRTNGAFQLLDDLVPARADLSPRSSQKSTSSESIHLPGNSNLSRSSSNSTFKPPSDEEPPAKTLDTSSSSSSIHDSLPPVPTDDEEEPIEIKPRRGQNDEEVSSIKEEKTPKRQYRAVENLVLVWLDASLENPNQETLNTKQQLRQVTRTLQTFSDPAKCLQLFQEVPKEKIFLVISGSLSERVLSSLSDWPQVVVVYIYCQQQSKYEHLAEQYPVVKGAFTEIDAICQCLKIDCKQWDNDLSTFQICSDQRLFVQNQLFKSSLLEIEYDSSSKDELIAYCLKLYTENQQEIDLIQDFADNYQASNAIQWYTKDGFAYHMLNRAIRTKDVKMLMEMGFFLRDIHQQLEEIYSQTVHRTELTVFRGQGMKLEHFEELQRNPDSLLSFNGFVSTSARQDVAHEFAQRSLTNGFPVAVLFRIKIDPKSSSSPFISVEDLSSNPNEYEILLSFQSIFQIDSIEQLEENLWQVDLNLTDQFIFAIESEKQNYQHLENYEKLGEILVDMNELTKAKDLYEMNIPSNTSPKYSYVYQQLALIAMKLEAPNQAVLYYNLALHSKCRESLTDRSALVSIHKEMGKIFYQQQKYREAVEKFENVLDLQFEHFSSDDFTLIDTYEYLATIYEEEADYQTALDYREKQLDIQEDSSMAQESDVARTQLKIAACLEKLNRFEEALERIQASIDVSPMENSEADERQMALERIRELMN